MKTEKMPKELSNREADKCNIYGFIGAAIAVVTLLQHLYFMNPVWVAYVMIVVYCLTITSFVLLALKKRIAPVVLIVASSLLFLITIYCLLAITFSLLVTTLMLYSTAITIALYIEEMPAKLQQHYLYKKSNLDFWLDKDI